jgi:serine/threonine kinase 32
MNGGDLRFHISRKTFTEEAVRFWIAELGCALRYIHQQGIVHRDVKPDNVLLDSEGHVHLADFNVASDITPGKPLTSKSGTLAYLAPEVYTGKGYYSEVDWWSLGVLFYECIYNKRPFEANHHDALAQQIIKADPPFPVTSPAVSMPCLHAISSLLERNKHLRIGATGFSTFTDNPFFRDIDFEALENKEYEPIFCPSSEKTNFDATYDLEELLLEEAPLEARARKQKPRAELREDATQQEIRAEELHRMIETMFEPFNYTAMPQDRSPVVSANGSPSTTSRSTLKSHNGREGDSPTDPGMPRHAPLEKSRSIPTPRSQTESPSRNRSSTQSPTGSPPYAVATHEIGTAVTAHTAIECGSQSTNDPQLHTNPTSEPRDSSRSRHIRYESPAPPGPPPAPPSSIKPYQQHRPRGSVRSTSQGGGVQVVLNEHGSWSDMANQSQAMVNNLDDQRRGEKPSGMLGFLSRKKGRDRSPKAKEKERGVIGKEGARVIISQG